MGTHGRTRALAAAVVAAALASAGCLNPNLNPFPPGYPPYGYPAYPGYPPYPPGDKSAPPGVDNRSGEPLVRAQYQPPPTTPPASVPLPPPNQLPVPTPQGQPQPGQQQQPGQPPGLPVNPHQLGGPTATGGRLDLKPNELPIDRAVELSKRIDEVALENAKLITRIRTLEANGLSREQALNETLREIETATAEVVKARGDLQAMRGELTSLRDRVKLAEKNELETLQKVILLLEKLLEPDE
jgi:hypothetical protein